MKAAIHKISLDVLESQSQHSLQMKKRETAREIHITMREGGKPYVIGEDCFAIFSGRKSDGTPFEHDCVIEDNTIIYKIHEQTTSEVGLVKCEIKLYGVDNAFLCSANFTIVVVDKIVSEEEVLEEEEDINALTALYSIALSAIADVEEATDNANEIADTLQTKLDNGEFKGDKGDKGEKGDKGDSSVTDQTYNPTSENAQSGVAVAEAIELAIGDIETALDSIIAIQESFIGGAE